MSEAELVDNSTILIRTIKKQGFISKENIDLLFTYLNHINGTKEEVTYCTTCVERKLKDLIQWTKSRMKE